jgi:hypothetical protein
MITAAQSDVFSKLSQIMSARQFDAPTRQDIEQFFASCREGMDTDSEKLLATLYLKALNQKIHSERIGENIYLGKYDISQIQLFNILIEKFPFVKYSQQITNNAIVAEMQGEEEVTLMDIGIGLGTQVLNIIERCKSLKNLKKLHVVGIEPFGDALEKAGKNILAQNGQVPFEIHFTGIQDSVENIDLTAIPGIGGKIIVNASLALHHIQSDQQRQATIAQIKALNPGAFFLIEPNVNHYEPNFFKRFVSSYHHFSNIFQVIDQIEHVSNDDKNALKLFFGREIEDIIGKEEQDRFEKHEPATRWIERLKQSQFNINSASLSGPASAGCGVEIKYHQEGYIGFTHVTETVLAIIYAN